ncbi:MAG: CusA/CzcA family heavy metal efflux RND transporter, partial [Cyclobacteriaceae bacterium]|nr:CusA/CzcA family heavy metal efflux RND transporter [Cyclobacteriaceae bacterium]
TPIFIKDIAKVGFGSANRFGAITANGEGEKVLGQVMMLKDANSKQVIEAVKTRVAEVQSGLPQGITINPFLERSELIGKTTFTIAENLILGCLIVVFVVVVLLGNLRSGLVVASVIPLSLLFALSLMYIFGVDANLMSLGAIDFGIIIDGAVIIVEYIAFKITSERTKILTLPKPEQRNLINNITFQGASKMMHSAVFGQLIIIIVFIPILSLTNVEGKMFRPMAMAFSFALTGAMVLCFTYVPVMAALFIKPSDPSKKTLSSRLISFLENKYRPTISWALRKKKLVITMAVALLVVSGVLFSRMGGEFVPTLDEGDFVIQPVLKTGTSLSKTIEATNKMEIILKKFPEVSQVVSRIGAAEVPTDPMSMEESDVIIKLKPKSEWTSAQNKDELADLFKEALSVIPGVEYEFTQPIEMRFNELITGVRADLAIKIFGEDLDILYKKALEIHKAIENVEGAADITVEKITGLPNMAVKYDRKKVAKYGLNIEDLNTIITAGFAGMAAGTVFEGEKQFDLVVRFDQEHRSSIESLENSSIKIADGSQIPLSEFAEITYTKGPAKISRDNTNRRIVVGVNVRNRDLESVVKDVQKIIESKIKLPTGYYVSYGGQFENLRAASDRLKIAVPIALLLIFVLLYFAFSSVKDALLIYSAIPLASVGGILALYFRDMPFSISAGVGFIALFGIAVLNGIVLIEEFKELKAHGVSNINRRILMGTHNRLRPVLLTASAAALGFLPMAISTSAGAEVQRPLASVVVGGLISATALTLVVLPVLYVLFDRKKGREKSKTKYVLGVLTLLILFPLGSSAQQTITLPEALEMANQNNKELSASRKNVQLTDELVGTSFNLDNTNIYFSKDQNNMAENGVPLNVWGVSQSLQFPTVYKSHKEILRHQNALAEYQYQLDEYTIDKEVTKAYHQAVFWKMVRSNYLYLDSLYSRLAIAAQRRFEEGQTNILEQLTAQSKQKEVHVLLNQTEREIEKSVQQLNSWIQSEEIYDVSDSLLTIENVKGFDSQNHPGILLSNEKMELAKSELQFEKNQLMPTLHLDAFRGNNNGPNNQAYNGFKIGVGLPLFFGSQNAKIKASKTQYSIYEQQMMDYKIKLESRYNTLMIELKKFQEAIDYYNTSGKTLSIQIMLNANKSFSNGGIDYIRYIALLENAKSIEITYLNNLINYNMTALEVKYLMR